ncbi:MAG: NAD-binding protein [Desulfobulbaceae bacterium]|nr:NAD-binding protein [Desulfobulbaceae bacterium]
MRIVFVGTNKISLITARTLSEEGHEVVFIERNKEKIDKLSDEMDCGFILGDGTAPDILKEVGPKQTDFLFCMTDNDRDNIIAGLVGRSLGFSKVIVKIEDLAYEHICSELGLRDVIVPTSTISRYLVDMIMGRDATELTSVIRDDARFFTFVAGEEENDTAVGELDLPKKAKIICYYREDRFHLAQHDTRLETGDEVVVLTHVDMLEALQKKWPPGKGSGEQEVGDETEEGGRGSTR